jgi:hypothetical protein
LLACGAAGSVMGEGSDFGAGCQGRYGASLRRGCGAVAFCITGRTILLRPRSEDLRLADFDLSTPWGRLKTYLHYLWNDHAYLRLGFQERPLDQPRAGARQPALAVPAGLVEGPGDQDHRQSARRLRRQLLRAGKGRLRALGLKMVDFVITSREVPIRERVRGPSAVREHRISGPDALQVRRGPGGHHERALRPLSPGPADPRGDEGAVVRATCTSRPARPACWTTPSSAIWSDGEPKGLSFTDWVESDDYDPVAMKQTFRAGMLGKALTDKILRRE